MSSRCRSAAPTIVPFTGTAMRRHGGRPRTSTRSLLRTGCGSTPAFTVQLRLEISVCREARQQSNRRKMVPFDRRRDPPTNDVVPAV